MSTVPFNLNRNSYIFYGILHSHFMNFFKGPLYLYLKCQPRKLKEILTVKVEPGEANVSYSIEDGVREVANIKMEINQQETCFWN